MKKINKKIIIVDTLGDFPIVPIIIEELKDYKHKVIKPGVDLSELFKTIYFEIGTLEFMTKHMMKKENFADYLDFKIKKLLPFDIITICDTIINPSVYNLLVKKYGKENIAFITNNYKDEIFYDDCLNLYKTRPEEKRKTIIEYLKYKNIIK